jgi:hypothetical protein
MAIAAEERALPIRFERELGDLGAALRAGPVTRHHGAFGPEIVVLHYLLPGWLIYAGWAIYEL